MSRRLLTMSPVAALVTSLLLCLGVTTPAAAQRNCGQPSPTCVYSLSVTRRDPSPTANRLVNTPNLTAVFLVKNTGTSGATQQAIFNCAGGTLTVCGSVSPTSAVIAVGATVTVTVTYSTGNTPGSGQVKLTANGVYSTSASAAYTVPILSFGVAVDPLSPSTAQRESGQSYSDVFNVRNTGSTNTTFTVSCSATGLTCNYPTTQVPVNAASTVAVTVPYTAGSVGTGGLTLTAVGTNTVTGATYSGTGAYTVPIVRHAVAVTPDGVFAPTRLTTGGPYIDSVLVQNTGTVADTYSLTCTQTGAVNGCGILGATSLSLAPNASAWIKATYSVSATAVDSGVLTVRAASNYAADVGSYKVVAAASTPQPPAVSAADGMPGATVERPLCLTIALGAAAAAECGDLRVVHALPATRTMNKSRVPMLLYNSQFAHPYPVIAANVTLPATALTPDRVTASLKVNGVPPGAGITQGEWSGNEWGPGRTRRIALTFDGLGYATGLHPYTVEVINWYGTNAQTTTFTGVVAIVNRSASPMGAGWWLAGLEQLVKVTPDTVVWVGGDGSVREYIARISDTVWGAPNVDYPDSLRRDPQYRPHRPLRARQRVGDV